LRDENFNRGSTIRLPLPDPNGLQESKWELSIAADIESLQRIKGKIAERILDFEFTRRVELSAEERLAIDVSVGR